MARCVGRPPLPDRHAMCAFSIAGLVTGMVNQDDYIH